MESQSNHSAGSRVESWIALALCAAVLLARTVQHLIPNRPTYAKVFAPDWISLAAVVFAVAGIIRLPGSPQWLRVQRVLRWSGLLLMIWAANGLPFDIFRVTRLIPLGVDWPGFASRTLAFAAAVVLARLALARPDASARAASWYGYAAFVLALPYPILRAHWAFGGMLGLSRPDAAGKGFAPLLIAVPFVLAAALSLLLVRPRRCMPRWLLLASGWFATGIVALIGPAACWALVTALISGKSNGSEGIGIAIWVFGLFYGSWFLWAIAAGAATYSYQLRTATIALNEATNGGSQ